MSEHSGDAADRGPFREPLEGWLAGSQVVGAWQGLSARLGTAAGSSAVGRCVASVGRWIRNSWCYRWLTAEPEPDVIVIDLRETLTVGPLIRLLECLLAPLAAAWDRSTLEGTLATVEAAPVRALGVVVGVAVLVESALALAVGGLTGGDLVLRFALLGFAAIAVQVPLSTSELGETYTGRVLRAVFTPPEPAEGRDCRDDSATEDGD